MCCIMIEWDLFLKAKNKYLQMKTLAERGITLLEYLSK